MPAFGSRDDEEDEEAGRSREVHTKALMQKWGAVVSAEY